MKQFLLLAGWIGLASAAQAQAPTPAHGTVISVGAFGLAPNAGVQAEQRLSRHFSLGLQGNRYFGHDFPGYQAALLGRYYFRPRAPLGLYLQAQAGVFQHTGHTQAYYPGYSFPPSEVRLGGAGGGLGLGYQLLLGQHLAVNAALGLKYYHLRSLGYCDCGYVGGDWYGPGQPGSVFDGQLSVGYAF